MKIEDIVAECWVIFTLDSCATTNEYRFGPEVTTYNYWKVTAYSDKEEWKKEIEMLMNPKYGSKKHFKAGKFNPATLKLEVKIDESR